MEYTGERYLPEVQGGIALEHRHRYLLACEYAKDKVVLDIASGEGYGSFILSGVAARVTGVDISAEAVAHAKETYVRENLEYRQGSAAKIPLEDASVDMVVSFETIEHHTQHEEMLQEIKRVLRPGGILYMSSPDRIEYSDVPGYSNEYHVKELTKDEFEELISRYFTNYAISGQRIAYGSIIGSETPQSAFCSWNHAVADTAPISGMPRAVYILALASDGELPNSASGILEDSIEHADACRVEKENTAHCMWQKSEVEKYRDILLAEKAEAERYAHQLNERLYRAYLEIEKHKDNERQFALNAISLHDAIAERDAKLEGIYSSLSWWLMSPFRSLYRGLNYLLNPQSPLAPSAASQMLAKVLCLPLVLWLRKSKEFKASALSLQSALADPAFALGQIRSREGFGIKLLRLSYVVGWVFLKAGGVCMAAKILVDALRSESARGHLIQYLQPVSSEAEADPVKKKRDSDYIHRLVVSHDMGCDRPQIEKVSVRAVAAGNHFFREIAQLIACGFADAGVQAEVCIDEIGCECPVCATDPKTLHLIIAPHEYFHFIPNAGKWPFAQSRLWLLNTEQSHTPWFEKAAQFFPLAKVVLDMDFDLSRTLVEQGFRAEHLPLGFSSGCKLFDGLQPVDTNLATRGLPLRIRNSSATADPLASPLHERPLDCCFFGASVSRRAEFFAQNAALFSTMQAYLRLLPMNVPLQPGVNTSLTTEATSSIVRRSKISLNIHQSEMSYFEWHRIVLQGLWQGALVVSEPCTTALPFQPNIDYVSVDLVHMPEALRYFTSSEEGRAVAEKIRASGYRKLTTQCLIGDKLRELLDIYGSLPGVKR